MHNAALAAAGLVDWRYQLLPMPPDGMVDAVRALPDAGFVGASVTIPHKETVMAAADEIGDVARAVGAANTLVISDGSIRAENTDAPGFMAALPSGPGDTAMLLGAGGSARAAAWALKDAGVEVSVWNRTPARAEALAADFGLQAVSAPRKSDLLVNCTAAGMAGDPFGELPLTPASLSGYGTVVDFVYSGEGCLLEAASAAGCEVVDGIDILVAQGAIAFEMWTGRTAPVGVMDAAARSEADGGSSAS